MTQDGTEKRRTRFDPKRSASAKYARARQVARLCPAGTGSRSRHRPGSECETRSASTILDGAGTRAPAPRSPRAGNRKTRESRPRRPQRPSQGGRRHRLILPESVDDRLSRHRGTARYRIMVTGFFGLSTALRWEQVGSRLGAGWGAQDHLRQHAVHCHAAWSGRVHPALASACGASQRCCTKVHLASDADNSTVPPTGPESYAPRRLPRSRLPPFPTAERVRRPLVQRDRPPDRFAAAARRLNYVSSGPV